MSRAQVSGLPWLSPGSCDARTSMNITALHPRATTRVAAIAVPTRDATLSGVFTNAEANVSTAPTAPNHGDTRPAPITATKAPVSNTAERHRNPLSDFVASTMATGEVTNALRCNGTASAIRYAVSSVHRVSPVRPALSPAQIDNMPSARDAA